MPIQELIDQGKKARSLRNHKIAQEETRQEFLRMRKLAESWKKYLVPILNIVPAELHQYLNYNANMQPGYTDIQFNIPECSPIKAKYLYEDIIFHVVYWTRIDFDSDHNPPYHLVPSYRDDTFNFLIALADAHDQYPMDLALEKECKKWNQEYKPEVKPESTPSNHEILIAEIIECIDLISEYKAGYRGSDDYVY